MSMLRFSYRRQIAGLALTGAVVTQALFFTPRACGEESTVQKELERRIGNARKAYDLLNTGDLAYKKGDYKAATRDYAQAFDLLPVGALSMELRTAAAERYATAATERSRALAKHGSYDEARQLLETVLNPNVAPGHLGALKLKRQIDDPIRYNHAITPEHVDDVVSVGRLLRQGDGFYKLGQYDRAHRQYQSVLRIDPFNKAARRGMERISTIKADYYRAAQDHTRSGMLAEVAKNWELFVPAAENLAPPLPLDSAAPSNIPDLRAKLSGIIVESIDLDNFSLQEALDYVRIQSRLGDAPDASGEQPGVNIVLNLGDPSSDIAKSITRSRVNMKARGLPLSKILDYITEQTRTQWRTDGVGILITPLGVEHGEIISKTFRVPPNFLQSATIRKQETDDPFGESSDEDGKLPERASITDFLKQNGISFPDGAAATYTPASNTLIVRNTPGNIDLVDQLVSLIAGQEPVMVIIKTTIMRIEEQDLKELGFDWAITPLDFSGEVFLGGGNVGSGNPLAALSGSPVTAGIRSGNNAIPSDTIGSLITGPTSATTDGSLRAPGIFKVTAFTNGAVIEMMMRGLDQNKATDIMVKPSTISRSGERSKIEVIREFIYPTEYEPPEVPNEITTPENGGGAAGNIVFAPIAPATPTAFETRNTGVTLEVEPTVGPDKKYIDLSLRPELVELDGFVNYGSPIEGAGLDFFGNPVSLSLTENSILMPVFKVIRTQDVSLKIQDGATVVLGGLITSKKTTIEDKIPILGDIPIAGRLFRSDSSRTIREAVIITVNVELVDPTGTPWRQR